MRSEQGVTSQAAAIRLLARKNPDETSQVFTRPPQTPSPQVSGVLTVSLVRSLDELRNHRLELGISPATRSSNVFYEPILAEPAVPELRCRKQLEFVCCRSEPGAPGRGSPALRVLPLPRRTAHYRGLPVTALTSFKHLHCFLDALIRRNGASQTRSPRRSTGWWESRCDLDRAAIDRRGRARASAPRARVAGAAAAVLAAELVDPRVLRAAPTPRAICAAPSPGWP